MSLAFEIPNLDITYGQDKFVLGGLENLSIKQGEILGILGESGCGKTTFGKCLVGLMSRPEYHRLNVSSIERNGIVSEIRYLQSPSIFKSGNLMTCTRRELLAYRKEVQMIFQNPRASLNLNMPVNKIFDEAVRIGSPEKNKAERVEIYRHFADVFDVGGAASWQHIARSTPKQLSGGEQRRVGIAKVFSTQPDVIVADEPVASLDVSVRGKILNAIYNIHTQRLQQWHNREIKNPLTLIIISHDFQLIREICDRIFVFYGDIRVQRGTLIEIVAGSQKTWYHPYTKELAAANDFLKNYDPKIQHTRETLSTENFPSADGDQDWENCIYIRRCKCEQLNDSCHEAIPFSHKGENLVRCIHQ